MSFCRFIEADAYIYDDTRYGLYCCACLLSPVEMVYSTVFKMDMPSVEGFVAGYDYNKMLDHIAEHRNAGHYIPERVDERLIFERDCEHDFNESDYCNHCRVNKDMLENWTADE